MEFSVPNYALREVWFEIDLVVTGLNGPFPDIAFSTSVSDYTYTCIFIYLYLVQFSLLIVPRLRSCITLHHLLLKTMASMNDCPVSHLQWNESMVWGHVSGICFIEMRLNYRLFFPGTMVVVFVTTTKSPRSIFGDISK